MGLNYLEGQKIYPRVDRRNRFVTNKALATILEFVMIQTTELINNQNYINNIGCNFVSLGANVTVEF
jgi:hypothetical protein